MLSLQAQPFNFSETSILAQKSESYDNNNPEPSPQEQDQGTWYTTRNPKKQKAQFDGDGKKSNNHRNHTKRTHNKQEDELSGRALCENGVYNGKGNSKGSRKDRKPDRQLYSVREKRADNQKCNNKIQKNPEMARYEPALEAVKEIETLGLDDDRSFVSDVSTAISDRLKNLDNDRVSRNDDFKDTLLQVNGSVEERVLFTLCLGSENNYETVLIFEGETNYEAFLDQVCERHRLSDREALYFKINVLQMACNMHPEPTQVEPVLNRLLDINYNILLSEMEIEDETSPLFYSGNKDFLEDDLNENSC